MRASNLFAALPFCAVSLLFYSQNPPTPKGSKESDDQLTDYLR